MLDRSAATARCAVPTCGRCRLRAPTHRRPRSRTWTSSTRSSRAHVGKALATPALTRQQVYRRLARTDRLGRAALPPAARARRRLPRPLRPHARRRRASARDRRDHVRARVARRLGAVVWTGSSAVVRPTARSSRSSSGRRSCRRRRRPPTSTCRPCWARRAGRARRSASCCATGFVRGSDQPSIRPDKRDGASVQNDVELVGGLTPGVLDRLARLWRLHVATGVPVPALDLLVRAIRLRRPAPTRAAAQRRRRDPRGGATARGAAGRRRRVRRRDPQRAARARRRAAVRSAVQPRAVRVSSRASWPQQMPASFVHPSFAVDGHEHARQSHASAPARRPPDQPTPSSSSCSPSSGGDLTADAGRSRSARRRSSPCCSATRCFARALLERLPTSGACFPWRAWGASTSGSLRLPSGQNRVMNLDDLRDAFAAARRVAVAQRGARRCGVRRRRPRHAARASRADRGRAGDLRPARARATVGDRGHASRVGPRHLGGGLAPDPEREHGAVGGRQPRAAATRAGARLVDAAPARGGRPRPPPAGASRFRPAARRRRARARAPWPPPSRASTRSPPSRGQSPSGSR